MIKDENYVLISGWMKNELNLKGVELFLYAIIYGFSQSENGEFAGSIDYLIEWTSCTKKTVINALTSLVEKGLVEKEKVHVAGGIYSCRYRATTAGVKITPTGVKISNQMEKLHPLRV